MIKGILFDWVGVLVKEKNSNYDGRNENNFIISSSIATEKEIIELVNSYEKYEPLWEILPQLNKYYKLCVVNNGPKCTIDYWEKYFRFSKHFKFFNSEELGMSKPNPYIYMHACDYLGIKTSEALYMDDNKGFPLDTIKLGMKFIYWESHDLGFKEFKEFIKKDSGLKLYI